MALSVSILGCGWLGLAFGKQLLSKGYRVKGSVTSHAKTGTLSREGIEPYQIVLHPNEILASDPKFFETDVLMIAIPPKRIENIEHVFPEQIKQLVPYIEQYQIKKVLIISSTSVYNETNQTVTEEDHHVPDKASGKAMLLAENLLLENPAFKTTVVRFGGLIGYDRNPARFLLNKKARLSSQKPVNLIHLDDCLSILKEIIQQNAWGKVFNACCPVHPTRGEFYQKAALVSGLPMPKLIDEPAAYKIVDSRKLIITLDFQFKYESPLDCLSERMTY